MNHVIVNYDFLKAIDFYNVIENKNLDFFGQFLCNALQRETSEMIWSISSNVSHFCLKYNYEKQLKSTLSLLRELKKPDKFYVLDDS